jgi:hypothetical protein
MNSEAHKAVNEAIRAVRQAIKTEKRFVIAAVERDEPLDVSTLDATKDLLVSLERARDVYEKGKPGAGPKRAKMVTSRVVRGNPGHTPSREFAVPILEALKDMGGSAESSKVLDEVAKRLTLKPADLRGTATRPTPRWRTAATWVRFGMTERGLVVTDHGRRGHWKITPAGERYLESVKGQMADPELVRENGSTQPLKFQ